MDNNEKNGKGGLRWFFKNLFLPILVGVSTYFVLRFINPPSLPNIDSIVIYNTGFFDKELRSPFKIDLQVDETASLMISVINNGNDCAEDLAVEFSLLKNNRILNTSKRYTPKLLDKKVKDSIESEKSFYEILDYLPSQSSIEYKFYLNKLIRSSDEFQYSVCSKSKNWSKSTVIKPKYSKSEKFRPNTACADEKLNKENHSNVPRAGILIGGYDPLIMANELFILLQGKNLISKNDALEIKKMIESYKEGILFGGINILKFNELIINKLLSSKAITVGQANRIVGKSRNAGGVLVGGYNVIILEVEILNILLKNKKITFEEGQGVIDRSKPNGS